MTTRTKCNRTALGLVVAAALLAGCTQTSHALVDWVPQESVPDLVAEADLIVVGTAGDSRYDALLPTYSGEDPRLNPLAGTGDTPSPEELAEMAVAITVVEFTVTEVVSGDAEVGQVIQVVQLGGKIGNRRTIVENATPLEDGDEALLFLSATWSDAYETLGGPQGQFTLDGSTYRSVADGRDDLQIPVAGLGEIREAAGRG